MRAYQLPEFGPEKLELTELPQPDLGVDQVRVRMRAASVNYRDFMIASGWYNPNLQLPLIPFSDGAGEVAELGRDVSGLSVGDRVTSLFWPRWRTGPATWETRSASTGCELPGVLAEEVVVHADHVCRFPDYLSYAEAATLPCAALTAWVGLHRAGNIRPGHKVLVQGTGGVSLFALQLAKAIGARVIIISSSDEKLERARQLGADEGINYGEVPEWGARVAELSGGGVDTVIEIGGGGTLGQSMDALALNGSVALIGALAGAENQLNLFSVVGKNAHLHGITVGNLEDYESMLAVMTENAIRPVISETFPFERAGDAIQAIAAGQHFGKLVIEIP